MSNPDPGEGDQPPPPRFAGRGIFTGAGRGFMINQPGLPAIGRGLGFGGAGAGRGLNLNIHPSDPVEQEQPPVGALGRGIGPGFGFGRGRGQVPQLGIARGLPVAPIPIQSIHTGHGEEPVLGQFDHPDDQPVASVVSFDSAAEVIPPMASMVLDRGATVDVHQRSDRSPSERGGSGIYPPPIVHTFEVVRAPVPGNQQQPQSVRQITPDGSIATVATTATTVQNETISSGGSGGANPVVAQAGLRVPGPDVAHQPQQGEAGVVRPQVVDPQQNALPVQPVADPPTDEIEIVGEKKTYRGANGTPFNVLTNFLRVQVEEDKKLYEYLITFDPPIDETRIRRQAIKNVEHLIGDYSQFDGQKLWLPRLLEIENNVHHVLSSFPNDPSQELKLSFRLVNEVSMRRCVQFYNVWLRKALRAMGYTEIQHDYYDSSAKENLTKSRLVMWPGVITAIDEYEEGLMLCLEQTHKVMRETNLWDFYNQEYRHKPNGMKLFIEAISNKIVMTTYNNLCYKVEDVSLDQNPLTTFPRTRNGVTTEISYVEYFRQQYGKVITDMTQPIILSRKKARKNDPQGEVVVGIIPELCVLTGLLEHERGNFTLMKEIIDRSRIPPNQRRVATKKFLEKMQNTPEALKQFESWGIKILPNPVVLSARPVLLPAIMINQNFTLAAANADFSRESTSKNCYDPIPLKKWVIFCGQGDRDKAQQFMRTYRSVIGALGITMQQDPLILQVGNTPRPFNANELRMKLRENVNKDKEHGIQFIVTVLPLARDDLYGAVKKHCVLENAIPSQVILAKTLSNEKRLRSVVQKVALQINCKLGGAIWGLGISMKDEVMFIGIDSHHSPDRKKPSMLGLVATLDNRCTKHFSKVTAQAPHQEDADAIKPLFAQALGVYYHVNGYYPNRVVVFRDGVGDGQLPAVEKNEVQQLKSMCLQFNEHSRFYFIVVQKRINERFFIKKGNNELDNPNPGSVLDHTITRRNHKDFFLVSQLVRQGTVSPTHYIVLEDSGDNKPDLMQKLAFSLTYMYFNWAGTIRVPAMCQYAHKLAMLAGQHLGGLPSSEMDRMLWYL